MNYGGISYFKMIYACAVKSKVIMCIWELWTYNYSLLHSLS